MTQQQLQELVRLHHPDMSESEVRIRLNNALKEFCRKTKVLKGAFQFDTVVDTRSYGLDTKIIEVESVDYDGENIKRLSGRPNKRDLT